MTFFVAPAARRQTRSSGHPPTKPVGALFWWHALQWLGWGCRAGLCGIGGTRTRCNGCQGCGEALSRALALARPVGCAALVLLCCLPPRDACRAAAPASAVQGGGAHRPRTNLRVPPRQQANAARPEWALVACQPGNLPGLLFVARIMLSTHGLRTSPFLLPPLVLHSHTPAPEPPRVKRPELSGSSLAERLRTLSCTARCAAAATVRTDNAPTRRPGSVPRVQLHLMSTVACIRPNAGALHLARHDGCQDPPASSGTGAAWPASAAALHTCTRLAGSSRARSIKPRGGVWATS